MILAVLVFSVSVSAIAVSPNEISMSLAPGDSYQREILIIPSDISYSYAGDLAEHILLKKKHEKHILHLDLPKNIKSGNYSGKFFIAEKNKNIINLGIILTIHIEVESEENKKRGILGITGSVIGKSLDHKDYIVLGGLLLALLLLLLKKKHTQVQKCLKNNS